MSKQIVNAWRALWNAVYSTRWERCILVVLAPVYAMVIMLAGFGAYAGIASGAINGDWVLALMGLVGVVLFYVLFVPKKKSPTCEAAEAVLRRYREQGEDTKNQEQISRRLQA